MSQQIATKEAVIAAMEKLMAENRVKATAAEVRGAIRGGSMTTILRYMQEIERETEAASNPPGTWADYQALCRKLDATGRLARQSEIDALSRDLHATRQELDALRHKHSETEVKQQEALTRGGSPPGQAPRGARSVQCQRQQTRRPAARAQRSHGGAAPKVGIGPTQKCQDGRGQVTRRKTVTDYDGTSLTAAKLAGPAREECHECLQKCAFPVSRPTPPSMLIE
jgi:hypothetical protein